MKELSDVPNDDIPCMNGKEEGKTEKEIVGDRGSEAIEGEEGWRGNRDIRQGDKGEESEIGIEKGRVGD